MIWERTKLWIWDRKYQNWMQAVSETHFIAAGGKGYSIDTLRTNEKLEEDEWLPTKSDKTGTRFVFIPAQAIIDAASFLQQTEST